MHAVLMAALSRKACHLVYRRKVLEWNADPDPRAGQQALGPGPGELLVPFLPRPHAECPECDGAGVRRSQFWKVCLPPTDCAGLGPGDQVGLTWGDGRGPQEAQMLLGGLDPLLHPWP